MEATVTVYEDDEEDEGERLIRHLDNLMCKKDSLIKTLDDIIVSMDVEMGEKDTEIARLKKDGGK